MPMLIIFLTVAGCFSLGKLITLPSTVKQRQYFLSHMVVLRTRVNNVLNTAPGFL